MFLLFFSILVIQIFASYQLVFVSMCQPECCVSLHQGPIVRNNQDPFAKVLNNNFEKYKTN